MTLINLIPGCKFRTDEEGEIVGVDDAECGEWAVCPSFCIPLPVPFADPSLPQQISTISFTFVATLNPPREWLA